MQLSYLDNDPMHIVNVASVPHRSPFRYPGGKTWLIPRIRRWLSSLGYRPKKLIEPFAGGAIVSLTAVAEELVTSAELVELDSGVASVWQTILENENGAEWLGDRIVTFDLNLDNIQCILSATNLDKREYAFQTILKNRVNRGGIMAPGAGLIKQGENGKGFYSRWYPETLKKRILEIAQLRHRLTIVHGDGIGVMRQNAACNDVVYFIDPPYTILGKGAGSRLYTHFQIDHNDLFKTASEINGAFLITYSNSPEVVQLAKHYGFDIRVVAMKNTHHAKLTELLIGRDLRWLD